MAGKKVKGATITFEITDNGSLKLVEKNSKRAAQSVKKVGQSAHSADRSLKGAANASSGASKNFSKLSQGITGGLVPAYATLAANLFAVDALFRFLKNSADYRVLTQGQLAFAAATGVAYKSLAHDLQNATRNMINFKEAAQAGAIGRAAGLSAGQLTELSEAAFTVSMALGRDVTDSFNRLVRGVTKAEPELLDELGIILRLEEATTKYAASLGLNKNQLSIYQKSQAVVNEVLDQAERKFGKINAIMEPQANAIAQLGIAFEHTVDSIRPFISAMVEPVAQFFGNNITAAAIAMGLFATTIIKSVIPSHGELMVAQQAQTTAHAEQLDRLHAKTKALEAARKKLAGTPIAQDKFTKRMSKDGFDVSKVGGASGQALRRGEALTNRQIGAIKAQVTKATGAFSGMSEKMKTKYIADLNAMQNAGTVTAQKFKNNMAASINFVQIKTVSLRTMWTNAMGVMAGATRAVTSAMTGLMSLLSYFGIAILLFQAAKAGYDKFFGPDQGDIDDFNERVDTATTSLETLNKELLKMGEVARRGLLEDEIEAIGHLSEAVASANLEKVIENFQLLEGNKSLNPEAFNKLSKELVLSLDNLSYLDDRFANFADTLQKSGNFSDKQIESLKELTLEINSQGAAVKQLQEIEGELVKEQNRLVQSLPKVPYQNLLTLLQQQAKAYSEMGEAGKEGNELANANLEYYIKIQERAIGLQKLELKLKKELITLNLGGAGSTTQEVKYAQELLKLKTQEHTIDELQLKIKASKLDKDSVVLKGMQQQLELAKETLDVQKMQVTMAGLMAEKVFSTYNDMFKGVYKDFGAGIGKAIRGEANAFADIGKNLTKTLSNAIGDAIAKDFLDDVIPDFLKPKDVAEEINKAGTYHANLVKEKIIEGGEEHSYAIAKVANGMTEALRQIQVRQNTAAANVAEKERNRALELIAKRNVEKGILERKDTKEELPSFIKSAEGQEELFNFAMDNAKDGGTSIRNTQRKINNADADLALIGKMRRELLQAGEDPSKYKIGKDDGFFGKEIVGRSLTQADHMRSTNKRLLTDRLDGQIQDFSKKFEEELTSSIIQVQKDIGKLDKDIEGLTTTVDLKQVEMDQFRNANQNRVDQIDDGSYNKLTDNDTLFNNDYGTGNGDGEGTAKEVKGLFGEEFGKNLNLFSGTIGLLGAVAGKDEATAKVMTVVAKLQMANALMTRVNLMMEQKGAGLKAMFSAFIGAPARQGGIMSKHGRSYSDGGVADGPSSGYPAVLHGKEAVVPLPNGRSIPVDMGKGGGGTNNVSINVNMAEGTTETVSDRDEAKALGVAINQAVYQVLEKEQRQGGLLGA